MLIILLTLYNTDMVLLTKLKCLAIADFVFLPVSTALIRLPSQRL